MKISTKWLKEFINIDASPEEIAEKMVFVGNEVESIKKLSDSTNLVVGHILEKEKHPNSDHLNVCKVDLKTSINTIVCGAPNVEKGQKVIVAKVGAKLPKIEIKKAKIRDVESNGMICSLEELGIESKYINEKGIIHVLDDLAEVGSDAIKYLELDDTVLEFELTSNRSDLLSVIGMAYEIGAIYNKVVSLPKFELKETKENVSDYISIKNETNDCSMYLSKLVKNVEIKESPNFIKARLIASGIRPINNVVDISNYVMLEYGQPLHFFDYDKLGENIIIRNAKEKEEIVTLDKQTRTLTKEDIVICDLKNPVAIAGVMGGLSTEVTTQTKNILIESANFDNLKVRQTSKRVLRSESSIRFEKGIDKEVCEKALARAAYLLQEYASGEVVSNVAGFKYKSIEKKPIEITLSKINNVLGMQLTLEDVKTVLDKLKFNYKNENNSFKVETLSRRLDVSIEEDLIEEIGRIHGYDKMVGTLPYSKIKAGNYSKKYKYSKTIRRKLLELGLNEIITYSLTKEEDVNKFTNDSFEKIELQSFLSEDKKVLRYSLIPSLIKVADYNLSRNVKDINIFEIGKSFYKDKKEYKEDLKLAILVTGTFIENTWQQNKIKSDFYTLKGIIESLLNYLGFNNRIEIIKNKDIKDFHPGKSAQIKLDNQTIGYFGEVHPLINKNNIYVAEINLEKLINIKTQLLKIKEVPKYPSIVKDMAFILNKSIQAQDVIEVIVNTKKSVITNVDVFDSYEGENIKNDNKSLAFKITFNDINKTLTDEEVNIIFNDIINKVTKKFKAELRNK